MYNKEIRAAAQDSGVFLYQVAKSMGISEPTMTRKLRFELSETEKQVILNKISEIAAQKNSAC